MAQHFDIVKRPDYAIEVVDNALQIIDLLRRSDESGLRVLEVAEHLGVARSTAHRLLSTLVYRGFAHRTGGHRYLPGPSLGTVAATEPAVPVAVIDILTRLRNETEETVSLLRLRGADVEFLTTVESRRRLRVGERTGTVLPARLTSGGKALLAALDETSVRRLHSGRRAGARSLGDGEMAELIQELAGVRAQGYALNLRRTESDICAIGAAIPRAGGLASQAAVALSAPATRTSRLVARTSIDLLRQACAELAEVIDG